MLAVIVRILPGVVVPRLHAGVAALAGIMTSSAGLGTASARDRSGASSSCGGNAHGSLLSCCAFALPSDRIGDCGSFRSACIHQTPKGERCNELLRV